MAPVWRCAFISYGANCLLVAKQSERGKMTLRTTTISMAALIAMILVGLSIQVSSAQATNDQQAVDTKSVASKTVKVPMYYQPPSTEQTAKVASKATLKTRRCGYLTYTIRDAGGSNYALQTYGFKSNSFREYYWIDHSLNIRQNRDARYPGWEKYWGGYWYFEVTREQYWSRTQWVPRSNHRYYGTAHIRLRIVPADGAGTCHGTIRGASGYIT